MKLFFTAALLTLVALTGCSVGGAEIDCDDVDDDATCTCDDGSEGVLRCTSAFIECLCDDADEWENATPVDAGTTVEDTGESDTDDADADADTEDADADASHGDDVREDVEG